MGPSQLLSVILSGGCEVVEISREERLGQMRRWRAAYLPPFYANSGNCKPAGFDWHVFSGKFSRSLSGRQALEAYREECPDSFFAIPEDGQGMLPAYLCHGGELPDFTPYCLDLYIFPESLEWTMAFTHESTSTLDLGPFFSRRDWVSP